MANKYEFGNKIKYYIKQSGRSQVATARLLGFHPSTLTKWLQGVNQIPFNVLQKLCELVQLDDEQQGEIFGLAGYDVSLLISEEQVDLYNLGDAQRAIKCFVSHNSADKPVAEQVARRLLDSGIDVWLDKWEILAGESLTSRIEEGIADANAFVILMSPHSMKAKWVKEELRIAIQRRLEDDSFALIPILLQDCEVPGFLKDYAYVDWRGDTDTAYDFLIRSLRGLKSKPQSNIGV